MKEGVVARKFLRAFAEWDLDTYESLLAPGAVEGRPQMGERFNGRATDHGHVPQPQG